MWHYPRVRTLGDLCRHNAEVYGGRTAFSLDDQRYDFVDVDRISNQIANGLLAQNVGYGDRVVFLGKNSIEMWLIYFAAAKIGACFCPMNWRLSVKELETLFDECDAYVAFVDDEFYHYGVNLCKALGRQVFMLNMGNEDSPKAFWPWCKQFDTEDPAIEVCESRPVLQLYTSGTTGVPKGVVMKHITFNNMRLCESLEPGCTWNENDVFLLCPPNFHLLGIGLGLQAIYAGAEMAIVRQFDPETTLKAIERHKVTLAALAPAMIQMLLTHPSIENVKLDSLKEIVYAGSPISLGVLKHALQIMKCQFTQFYGTTEASGAITLLRPEEHDLTNEKRLTSCGRPLPMIELKIVDDEDNECPVGVPGELLMSSPGVASGYFRKPEEWAKVYSHGWYRTGDIAYVDEDGFYYLVDRAKDMIISGGENIYSTEVENALSTHPAVQQVAVIGVPNEKWGEEVKALVILKPDAELTEQELIAYSKEQIASYKCPKSVDFMKSFPMTASGKVSKKDLRKAYCE